MFLITIYLAIAATLFLIVGLNYQSILKEQFNKIRKESKTESEAKVTAESLQTYLPLLIFLACLSWLPLLLLNLFSFRLKK